MKILSFALLTITGCAMLIPSPGVQADNDQELQTFNELFGSQIQAVQKSRATDDDLRLAQELYEAGESLEDDPKIAMICFENAAILALRSPVGYELAIKATQAIQSRQGLNSSIAEMLIEAHEKKYRALLRDDRESAASDYAEVLIETAHYLSLNGDTAKAQEFYREALGLARFAPSVNRKMVLDYIKSAQALSKVDDQIEQLKKTLIESPSESDATRLAKLYLHQKGDLSKAAQYAAFSDDEIMKMMLSDTQKPLEELSPIDQFKLGDWLMSQGEEANAFVKSKIYGKSKSYLESFLSGYEKKDVFAIKAGLHLEKLNEIEAAALATGESNSGKSSRRIRAIQKVLGYSLKQRPKEAVKLGDRYYLFIRKPLNWAQAQEEAKKMGGYLATITDERENKRVLEYLNKAHPQAPHIAVWIGGSDEKKEGEWTWVTGEAFQFKDWGRPEPNGRARENKIMLFFSNIYGSQVKWNDSVANRPAPYLIEWEF